MARVRFSAVALVCLGLLASAGGASSQSQSQPSQQTRVAIETAAVAPLNAVLKGEPGVLCAAFVPSVAEKLVRGNTAGVSCEEAAASVFAETATSYPKVTVALYARTSVKRLDVAGTHATVTITAEYTVSTEGRGTSAVVFELFGPQRVRLDEQGGVWRVSSPATLAVCLPARCGAVVSGLLFTYGERRVLPTLAPVPAAVRRAGGAEERQFEEGSAVVGQSGCLACHRIGVSGNRGPGQSLTHVGASLSEAEIEHAITHARAPMPSFAHLPAAKLRALVRFLSLLR
jgi:cytochrome c551/c552